MIYTILYMGCLVLGFIITKQIAKKGFDISSMQGLLVVIIYCMCFVMGLRMGVNEQVILNLGTIGIRALVISFFIIIGSIGAVTLTRKIFRMNKYGDVISQKQETLDGTPETIVSKIENKNSAEASAKQPQDGNKDNTNADEIKSTVIIVLMLAVGLGIGYFAVYCNFAQIIPALNNVIEKLIVVLLCILLLLVGAELSRSDNLFSNFKAAGIKVILFPLATILGSVLVGSLACIFMGFSLKEGLAISSGFGWYTYAPVVIGSAGSQYAVASAVSFMHNVIKEVSGIILIPVIARKIGYIEATAVPGIAAMDVCMPIVSRSCKPDTVVYSLATGLIQCLYTTCAIPLFMSL